MKRKICLFTAHSPQTGGGGVILRSLVAALTGLNISWYYIGSERVPGYEDGYLGKAIMGGAILEDIKSTWKMLTMRQVPAVDQVVEKLMQVDCDAYWIVSHNEGMRIALELVKRQQRPVHLTVHDDWAGALCARSSRYRLMQGPAKRLTVKTLQAVATADVISDGMRTYYEKLSGVKTEVCHRYLPAVAINPNPHQQGDQGVLLAGHIGSIYDQDDFISFLSVLKEYAESIGKKALLKMWGCHLNIDDIPEELKSNIIFYSTLAEEKVLPELSKCTLVYAMYPFDKNLATFAATSLPTKLTSYLQAGRPILGHGPEKSTLTTFINQTGTGKMWPSTDKLAGFATLEKVCAISFEMDKWQHARQEYFGEHNLETMMHFLDQQPK